jgi:hypothetical protein
VSCLAKQGGQERRRDVVVEVERHEFRIRVSSSGESRLYFPPYL